MKYRVAILARLVVTVEARATEEALNAGRKIGDQLLNGAWVTPARGAARAKLYSVLQIDDAFHGVVSIPPGTLGPIVEVLGEDLLWKAQPTPPKRKTAPAKAKGRLLCSACKGTGNGNWIGGVQVACLSCDGYGFFDIRGEK